jgi:hypothetical protein
MPLLPFFPYPCRSQYFVRAALQDEGLQVPPPPQSLQPNEYAAKGWTAPDEFGGEC